MPRMNEDDRALWLGPVHRERWTYACAKQLLERVIFASGRHHGLPFTIVRPFNVIGPRMDFVPGIDGEGVPRVLAAFMSALLRGRGPAAGRRRPAAALVRLRRRLRRRPSCASSSGPAACRGEIFNLGNPANDLSIAELAEQTGRGLPAAGARAPPRGPARSRAEEFYGPGYDDCDERLPDIEQGRSAGWAGSRRTTLAEMLPPIVRDYRARYSDRVAASWRPRRAPARRRGLTAAAR